MTTTTTDRRLGVTGGLGIKAPCKAVATSNITLSGEQTIGGVSCVDDDRVLVTAQTSSVSNGIYDVSTGAWTRSRDFNGTYDVVQGTLVPVANPGGTDVIYRVTSSNTMTIGTSAITFAIANAATTADQVTSGLSVHLPPVRLHTRGVCILVRNRHS